MHVTLPICAAEIQNIRGNDVGSRLVRPVVNPVRRQLLRAASRSILCAATIMTSSGLTLSSSPAVKYASRSVL